MIRVAKTLICTMMTLGFGQALGQPGPGVPHPRFGFKEQSESRQMPALTVFDIALGAADYPILQMPMSSSSGLRIDGSEEEQDLKRNQGAMLNVGLSRNFPTQFANYNLGAGIHRAATIPGGGIPTPASYVRVHANLAANIDLSSQWYGLQMTPELEARRSMYRNVESGHYVDAILLKSSVAKNLTDRWTTVIAGGYAPVTRFGLIQLSQRGPSGALGDSSANMWELSGKLLWSPNHQTTLHVCVAQENVGVKFKSTEGYRAYGLQVAPLGQGFSEKSYDLTTRYLTLGTSKNF
jgi:hypothetical protein